MTRRITRDRHQIHTRFGCSFFNRVPWQCHTVGLVTTIALSMTWFAARATALETVTVDRDGAVFQVQGEIIVEAQDGTMILRDRQAKIWLLRPDEIEKRTQDDIPFTLMDKAELGKALLEELPPGFSIHETKHYLICYNTSKAYAQWCGGLFERLLRAYNNFWGRRDLPLSKPEMPLVALIFRDKQSYRRYAVNELGDAVDSVNGYYSIIVNRTVMYDLTATSQIQQTRAPKNKPAEINRLLSQPMAGQIVATIIHEATHQIAFNCGLQQRYSDIQVWLNEGMAMYFETPDLSSKKGWRGMGEINISRLARFRNYLKRRPDDSLFSLIADANRMQGRSEDSRFQGPNGMLDAYSEAWALTYFLLTHHQEAFVRYLKFLSEKKPGQKETPEKRIENFETFFGDLESLDKKFIQRMQKEIKRHARSLGRQR